MYLVEIKIGNYKIRRYILNSEELGRLIQENIDTYEYVKIIEEVPDEELPKIKKRIKKNDKDGK